MGLSALQNKLTVNHRVAGQGAIGAALVELLFDSTDVLGRDFLATDFVNELIVENVLVFSFSQIYQRSHITKDLCVLTCSSGLLFMKVVKLDIIV
jgi:hypothetical protein